VLSRIRQLSGEQLSAFIEELFRKFFSQEKALLEQLKLLESDVSEFSMVLTGLLSSLVVAD